jgi:hypothetical protein
MGGVSVIMLVLWYYISSLCKCYTAMMFQMCGQTDSVSQLVNITTIPSSVLCGCEAWSIMQIKKQICGWLGTQCYWEFGTKKKYGNKNIVLAEFRSSYRMKIKRQSVMWNKEIPVSFGWLVVKRMLWRPKHVDRSLWSFSLCNFFFFFFFFAFSVLMFMFAHTNFVI